MFLSFNWVCKYKNFNIKMSTEDFEVQDIYRYSRKTLKKNHTNTNVIQTYSDNHIDLADSPRDVIANDLDAPRCSCDDSESEIASILHKKCRVIALAQQQLQKVLDETDKLLYDKPRCCRSVYDYLILCKEAILKEKGCQCILFVLICTAFVIGLLLGSASCGTYLRKFNSPILTCIDNFFISDKYFTEDDSFRGIV